jgi:hypothetical protein
VDSIAQHCNVKFTDHVTLNFKNNMSMMAVFLDIEIAFDTCTTWHPALLYKLHKLKFSMNLIKLISSFLSERKFTLSDEGEMSTHREIKAGVPQGSSNIIYIYILQPNCLQTG